MKTGVLIFFLFSYAYYQIWYLLFLHHRTFFLQYRYEVNLSVLKGLAALVLYLYL